MRNPRARDPFAELYGDLSERLRGEGWRPDVDVFETESHVVVRVELSGVRQEEVRVSVDGDELRIAGHRPTGEGEATCLHQMEIATGPFERRVRVPVPFDRAEVVARLVDGVLTVRLPKRGPEPHQVEIESSSSKAKHE